MHKRLLLILFIPLLIFINSCSKNEEQIINKKTSDTPESLYQIAIIDLQNKEYGNALANFKNLNSKFPLSNEAVKSQMMMGFIEYINLNYDEAIFIFDRLINQYPSHKDIDYAFYMKAISFYEQIKSEKLDGFYNYKSLEAFMQIINRFPESEYLQDSNQKIIAIKENIAAKHMDIGLFYLERKKYLAAMNRYKIVIKDYSKSKFTPEALHRLVEVYYILGMEEDAKKTASVIAYNYPNSIWYKYSYELINDEIIKSNQKSIFEKIKRLLDNDEEKE